MGWTANATVQDVSDNENPPVDILLAANGTDVVADGDDQVTSVEVRVVSPIATHLTIGARVQITANC